MYLGLDLDPSGVKALLINEDQTVLAEGHSALKVDRPALLWSERDPLAWIATCQSVIDPLRAAAATDFVALRRIAVSGRCMARPCWIRIISPCARPSYGAMAAPASNVVNWTRAPIFAALVAISLWPALPRRNYAGSQTTSLRYLKKTWKILLPKDFITLWLKGEHVSDMSDAAGTLWLDVARRAEPRSYARLVEGSAAAGRLRSALATEWGVGSVTVAGGGGDNAATACGLAIQASTPEQPASAVLAAPQVQACYRGNADRAEAYAQRYLAYKDGWNSSCT